MGHKAREGLYVFFLPRQLYNCVVLFYFVQLYFLTFEVYDITIMNIDDRPMTDRPLLLEELQMAISQQTII